MAAQWWKQLEERLCQRISYSKEHTTLPNPHPAGFGKRTRPQLLLAATTAVRSRTTTTATFPSSPPRADGASSRRRRRRSRGAGGGLLVGAGEVSSSGPSDLADIHIRMYTYGTNIGESS